MARPKKVIDEKLVRKLSGMGLTTAEIAAALECSSATLERRFAATLKSGRERLYSSLKRRQYKAAMSGNVAMLIWLGKQYMGQRDKVDQDMTTGGERLTQTVFYLPQNGRDTHKGNPAANGTADNVLGERG